MKKIWIAAAMTLALAGCSNKKALDIPTGTDVTVEKTDGVTVAGRLVEVQPDQVIVESRDGVKTPVQRSQIASMRQSAAVVERDAAKPNAAAPTPNAARRPRPPQPKGRIRAHRQRVPRRRSPPRRRRRPQLRRAASQRRSRWNANRSTAK